MVDTTGAGDAFLGGLIVGMLVWDNFVNDSLFIPVVHKACQSMASQLT